MNISENEIHIYRSSLIKEQEQVNELNKLLSKDELAMYKGSSSINSSAVIQLAAVFCRQLLSQYLNMGASEIAFSYADKGKPYIDKSRIKFNLAHSNEFVVYAVVLDTEVGIDLESKKEMDDALEIAERFFFKR
jgi:4'-phosphopantetheinyl transferase